MIYRNRGQWRRGKPCGPSPQVQIPVCAHDDRPDGSDEYHEERHDRLDACGEFCEEFCHRFCPAFCRDFCSDVRDEIHEKKRGKRHKRKRGEKREKKVRARSFGLGGSGGFLGCFCRRRETCREVACRTCQWVFCEMGRVCPSKFCFCFAQDFCREFCREFECVRRLLCECKRGRREICCNGCREICQRVCPCACRKNCCLVPIA